jgi:tetratricopeptide (TPR) repeat protein
MRFLAGVFFVLIVCGVVGCSGSNDVNSMLKLSMQQAMAGQWKNSLNLAEDVLAEDKTNIDALLLRAVAADNLDQHDVAIDSALQAVKINPDNFVALYTIGRLYSKENMRLSDAISYLEKAHNLNPNDINTLILLANNSIKLKSAKSRIYLSKLSSLDGAYASDALYLNMLGCANIFNNNLKEAGKNIVAAYNCDKLVKDPIITYNLAVLFDSYYKRSQNAVGYYNKFLELAAKNPAYADMKSEVTARLKKINR